jgi:hypothetical protein
MSEAIRDYVYMQGSNNSNYNMKFLTIWQIGMFESQTMLFEALWRQKRFCGDCEDFASNLYRLTQSWESKLRGEQHSS